MSSESDKSHVELQVFEEFIDLAGIPIKIASVKKRFPPEPDLVCKHDVKGNLAFELVELCDSNFASALASPKPNEDGIEYIRTSDPSWAIVLKKLRKTYKSDCPIELLCYTAGRIITPNSVIRPTLEFLLASYRHTFSAIWLMSRGEVIQLCH